HDWKVPVLRVTDNQGHSIRPYRSLKMNLYSRLRNWFTSKPGTIRKTPLRFRPMLQVLEERETPAILDPLAAPVVQPSSNPPLPDERLSLVGYDSLPQHNADGRTVLERPLLVVLVNAPASIRVDGAGEFERSPDQYRQVVFGPSYPNV